MLWNLPQILFPSDLCQGWRWGWRSPFSVPLCFRILLANNHISAGAWLLHFLSPCETCAQLLERMDFAHEVWWLSYQAIDPSFSRNLMWRSAFSEKITSRISGTVPFRKIKLGLGGLTPWSTPNWREFFNEATALLSPFFLGFLSGFLPICCCSNTHFSPNLHPNGFLQLWFSGGCQKSHDGFVHLPLTMSRHGFQVNVPIGLQPVGHSSNVFDYLSAAQQNRRLGCRFATLISTVAKTTVVSFWTLSNCSPLVEFVLVLLQHRFCPCD